MAFTDFCAKIYSYHAVGLNKTTEMSQRRRQCSQGALSWEHIHQGFWEHPHCGAGGEIVQHVPNCAFPLKWELSVEGHGPTEPVCAATCLATQPVLETYGKEWDVQGIVTLWQGGHWGYPGLTTLAARVKGLQSSSCTSRSPTVPHNTGIIELVLHR